MKSQQNMASNSTSVDTSSSNWIKKLRKIGICLLIFGIICLILVILIIIFGDNSKHDQFKHLLYDSFDESSDHVKLLNKLKKNKYSLVQGNKEQGLLHFALHYANQLANEGKTVFIQQYQDESIDVSGMMKYAKEKLDDMMGVEEVSSAGVWIVVSNDGTFIPELDLMKIKTENPKSKIVIFTPSYKQIAKGFKQFFLPKISQHEIQESIERNFDIDQTTADILYDYYATPQNIYTNLDIERYDAQDVLGDNFKELDDLDKEDVRILKDLCKFGQGSSEQSESQKLQEIGVISFRGDFYWRNAEARLNYELQKNLNCKNKVASSEIVEAYEAEEQQKKQIQELEQVKKKKNNKKKKNKGKK